jgi:GxxExxY protein
MNDVKALCDQVRQTSYGIHVCHGHGHLEKVYENALAHRLRKAGLGVKQQHPIEVYDEDGTLIGEYLADLFVENESIVELKAVKALANEHEAQILGYLKSARLEHSLLINFGSYRFEIRKFAWGERPRSQITDCVLTLLSALQCVRIFAHCEDWPPRARMERVTAATPIRTEVSRGMNGKGMEQRFSSLHSSAVDSPAFASGALGLRLCRAVFSAFLAVR